MCAPAAAAGPALTPAIAGVVGSGGLAATVPAALTNMFYASLAISALTTGAGFMAQSAQADAQNSYQEAMAKANNDAMVANAEMANRDFREQNTAENIKRMQNDAAAAQETERIQRERKEAMGTALASSEGAGQSLAFLMNDYMRQEARYRNTIKTQNDFDNVQSDIAIEGFRRTAQNRANGTQGYVASPVSSVNPLGAVLGFGGSALGAYDRYTQDRYRIERG